MLSGSWVSSQRSAYRLLQLNSIIQHPGLHAAPQHLKSWAAGRTRALRFLKDPRSASKKQKNTAELMPLLIARGPTPLQAAHIAENLPVSRVSGH